MTGLVLRGVEVGGALVDVRCDGGTVSAIGPTVPLIRSDDLIDARGGALLPGLNDHHLHLLAIAAADRSVRIGPPEVTSAGALALSLRQADRGLPPGDWIRAVGYHESVAGPLDRGALDALVAHRPVRVQHRSGALWVLNSLAGELVGLRAGPMPPGAEVDAHGEATGRLFREDTWLRAHLPPEPAPDLTAVGRRLARYGVTGLTDATPSTRPEDLRLLADAGLAQHLQLTGGPALSSAHFPDDVARGPVKVVVTDHDLPTLDELVGWFTTAHAMGRAVAVHCVSRVTLVLALTAWEDAGVRPGDRIEHASVVPAELIQRIAELDLRVVTQPNFIAERGDQYRREVDADEVADLYRCRSLMEAGIPVAAGTDAPFGNPDPWKAISAAIDRRTPTGHVLGEHERVDPQDALDLFLSPLDQPGGPARQLRLGASADLVLLGAPLADVLRAPSADAVELTVIDGRVVYRRGFS
jgi:predicted amidohydrolase YtcJ